MTPADPTILPRRSTDERGRAIPLTKEQLRERADQAIEALNALDEIGTEQEQRETLDALIRGIHDAYPIRSPVWPRSEPPQ